MASDASNHFELYFPYLDEKIYVVEKPAGMHTVGEESSLESLLKLRFPLLANLPDAGLIQRLDFETTGIIAGAFTEPVQAKLRSALSAEKFTKGYLVIVEGDCIKERAIEGYLYSRYRSSAKVSMQQKPVKRGQFSRSTITPVESLNVCSLVRVDCSIARRHQVRVHMASIGHPLVGDFLYGATKKLSDIGFASYPSSFILVAESLRFLHPETKQPLHLNASLTVEKLLYSLQSGSSAV